MASVSNGKRHVKKYLLFGHVVKRKQTREKVLCLNANSCNMQNQNKYFGNSQSFPPSFFNWNFATVYLLQYSSFWNHKAKSYGIKTTSYAHKTTSYAHKTTSIAHKTTSYLQNYELRSQNYKLRPQNYKLRVQNLQVWQLKLISFSWLTCYS